MSHLSGDERAYYVRGVFSRIAGQYDVMNRLMTGSQDVRWRREVIKLANLAPQARLLDLGTGTGDLAREALRQQPDAHVIAADFTLEMMRVGKRHGPLNWSAADALNLPFPSNSQHVITSGFLMRNVGDLRRALAEQFRVLKPGGRIIILETTRPRRNILSPFIWLHMHVIIPTLGGLISGFRDAYNYLPDSSESFLNAEDFAKRLQEAGFVQVAFRTKMFGTIAIHYAEKPA